MLNTRETAENGGHEIRTVLEDVDLATPKCTRSTVEGYGKYGLR